MITLGIDTTAVSASAALVKDGKILSEFYTNVGLQHSRTLMPMIQSLLSCCDMSVNQIDRFGITAGPGSFTGVRIGVAAIKGMALSADVPCIPLSTLEVIAHNLPQTNAIICPVMDARCNQVYNALFFWQDGILTRMCNDRAIEINALENELIAYNKPIIWVGDGANLCYTTCCRLQNHQLAPEHLRFQHAGPAALLAEKSDDVVSADHLAVSYLRPPQAVRAKENQINIIDSKG